MRRPALVALALLVVLAGCVAPFSDGQSAPANETDDGDAPGTPSVEAGGDAGPTATPASPGPAPADDGSGEPPTEQQADPESDRLGWEDGYWYNDPIAVDNSDGLNESEREAAIGRAMARVELVRGLEFQEPVNVSVVGRGEFDAGTLGGEASEATATFDNAKFEALFLVGTDEDSIDTQEQSLNASVGGYYSTDREAIVIVADGDAPTLDSERTLAHELVHALQDQHFGDLEAPDRTRDAYNGRNGLVEGDANAAQFRYMDRCEAQWRCLQAPSGGESGTDGSSDLHMGVYLLEYFPYADGPSLIGHLRNDTGWSGVDAAYDRAPTSAVEVIYPERYGTFEPRNVSLEDDLRAGWERVRPPERPDYGRLGQSALAATFAYTIYDDYNASRVVSPQSFLNSQFGQLDESDPLDYDLEPTRGWVGDRLHAYERDGEVAYVWRLEWASADAAERFADGYRELLAHWDGQRVDADTWRISEDSPFTGSIYLDVDGETVTVAKAPTTSGLGEVYAGAR